MNEIIYSFDSTALGHDVDQDSVLEAIKRAGFDGVEAPLHPNFIGLRGLPDYGSLKTLMDRHGLVAPTVSIEWPYGGHQNDLWGGDGLAHAAERLARALGSSLVVVQTLPGGSTSVEEFRKGLAGELILLYNHTEPANLPAAVELFDGGPVGGVGDALDWLYLTEPQIGVVVHADSILAAEENAPRLVSAMGDRLKQLYFSPASMLDGDALHPVFAAARGLAYTGPLAIRGGSPASLQGEVARLRDLWQKSHAEAVAIVER